jgi:hypothetical protein
MLRVCSVTSQETPGISTGLHTNMTLRQNPLRNEGSVFQDPDRVILDEAKMHVNTHTKHLNHNFIKN